MTSYKITSNVPSPATDPHILPSVNRLDGYGFGDAGSNSLLIADDAFVVATDSISDGIRLTNSASSWSVTLNGQVMDSGGTGYGFRTLAKATKLIVGDNGSITGSLAGLYAANDSSLDLTNHGYIKGASLGIRLGVSFTANTTLVNKITNTGTIVGNVAYNTALNFPAGALTKTFIANSGTINGNIDLSQASGTKSVTNSSSINGSLSLGDGVNTFTNTGSLFFLYLGGAGADKIINKAGGGLSGGVNAGGGTNSLTNDGYVSAALSGDPASYLGGAGDDTVVNSKAGFMFGYVSLGDAVLKNVLTNAGEIFANPSTLLSVTGGNGADTVTNTGKLDGGVSLFGGANTLTNSNLISGSYTGGAGIDKIYNKAGGTIGNIDLSDGSDYVENGGAVSTITGGNTGTIVKNSGSIYDITLGSGKDQFTDSGNGSVFTSIKLGAGDDVFTGGKHYETVYDDEGKDTYKFGSDADVYMAYQTTTDGSDYVDGGGGMDRYDASGLTCSLYINLGSKQHQAPALPDDFSHLVVLPHSAAFTVGGAVETVLNFENVAGTEQNDIIAGSDVANGLFGKGGNDDIFGYGGNDIINGGNGDDSIAGGLGADTLTGGVSGHDDFVYYSIKESGTTVATRDTIADFHHSEDHIDLSQIDADISNKDFDDAFHWIGANMNWGHAAGELRSVWTPTGQILEGDVNGDGVADFSIVLADNGSHVNFSFGAGADIIL